jgi:pimeloyl-ACP methyl ester carboxylesterase
MTARPALLVVVLLGTIAACGRGPRVADGPGPCTHVRAQRQMQGTELCEDVWSCQRPPGGRFDRVGLHRLAPCPPTPGPVVLYLPGMHMNGELPMQSARNDLRLYLAAAGIRTWGVDYRTHTVPAGATASDLAELGRWDAGVLESDAAWAADFVRKADPGPLVLAGFSYGAGLAYRLAGRSATRPQRLLILDGTADAPGELSGSGPAVDVGGSRLPWDLRQSLLSLVVLDPATTSPLPGYATAGAALADVLYTARSFGGNGGLANTRDEVSDIRVLARLLRGYDRWWPRAALETGAASPSGTLPVLAFASTRFGDEWVERVRASARAFGGEAAIVRPLPNYGHLDVLVGKRAARDVFAPALAWLSPGGYAP